MRKEISFLIVTAIIALGIVLIYYWGGQPTGFVTKLEQFENETACVEGGYVWYEENCYDEQPICSLDFLELCEDEINCTGAEGYWYNDICNAEEEPSCSNDLNLCLDETNCTGAGGYWYDANDDGNLTCNEAEEPSCSNNLSLCLDETNCTSAEGYWYNDICNAEEEPSCSNNLSLCNETNCESVGGGYWYDAADDGTITCNEYDCEKDSHCKEGFECVDNLCKEIVEGSEEELEQEIQILEEQTPILVPVLIADEIQNLKLNPGASAEISWNVQNDGPVFLTSCSFEPKGDYAEWISFTGESPVDIGIGNTANFDFNINISEEIAEGEYNLNVHVRCSQIYVSKQFVLEIETKKLEFDLIAADRTRLDRVRIIYSLGELTGEPQDVAVKFVLLAGAEEIAFIEENQSLKANATKEFKTNLLINESLEGELELVVNYNSEIYSSSVRKPIVLGAPIGGAAIFEGIGAGEIAIVVIVIVVLVVVLFVVKKIRSSGKTLKTLFQRKKGN